MDKTKLEITEDSELTSVALQDVPVGHFIKILSNIAGTPLSANEKVGLIVNLPDYEDRSQGTGFCALSTAEVYYTYDLAEMRVTVIPSVNIKYSL